ncbi:hypothetical protein DL764_009197 [Monosporascus ibericus]|uniref:Alkaline ceramidase 3 n=1 Tax=Monosporascus ibericus TaxID=155417 RepID=A0A4Q4SVK0_9PEZI|nr:hypothetical protein DL764_009197 [Monosporascus ibericus]
MSIHGALGQLSFPYRQSREGFFGAKTATLNFCEEASTRVLGPVWRTEYADQWFQDYAMSYWCAEVCNTLTNVLFLWLGCRGIRSVYRNCHPPVFVVGFVGYTVVGLGSTLFHATLKYPMQLVDELSMIYTTCLMCFATFSYARSKAFSYLLGTVLSRYYATKDPQFHQDAYAILTAIVVFSNMFIMEYSVRPALQSRDRKRAPNSPVQTSNVILKEMWLMVATGKQMDTVGDLTTSS